MKKKSYDNVYYQTLVTKMLKKKQVTLAEWQEFRRSYEALPESLLDIQTHGGSLRRKKIMADFANVARHVAKIMPYTELRKDHYLCIAYDENIYFS